MRSMADPDSAAPGMVPPRNALRRAVRRITRMDEFGVLAALTVMLLVIGLLRPRFVSPDSFVNLTQQVSLFGIMALGMVFLLAMREIDLSVGAIYGVTIVAAALLMQSGIDPWLAALAGFVIGIALGGVNAVLANLLQIPTIIVTLGTLSVFRGLALVLSNGRSIGDLPREHAFFTILGDQLFGIPVAFWVFLSLTILLHVVLQSTRYGYLVRAIGSNEQAARLSGIRIPLVRQATLMLQGALCGIAGLLTLAFFQSADSTLGTGYELLVIASAIIGGTGLAGGRGTVVGAFFGALVLGVISSGLVQFGVAANWSTFVTGVVIIAAVALDYFIRRRRSPAG
jgi:ribose transport system permease protein